MPSQLGIMMSEQEHEGFVLVFNSVRELLCSTVSYKVGRVQGALLLVGPGQNKSASLWAHLLQKLGELQGRWNTACGNALWAFICKTSPLW